MQRWYSFEDIPSDLGPTVVTLGNFDGVHRGHQEVLRRVVAEAEDRGLLPVALTFDPHPVAVLHPERAPVQVMSLSQRLAAMEEAGIGAVLVVEFTREYAQQTPEEFVLGTFVTALHAEVIVVGKDTRFGVRNSGDITTLRDLAARNAFEVIALEDVGERVESVRRWSSTRARAMLLAGEVGEAAEILGRPHRVTGVVVTGDQRGRELGFPTANLSAEEEGLVPADGVYAGWVVRHDQPEGAPDRVLPAAISIGTNPTFDGHQRRVEAHVLDRTDLDLYGDTISIDFVQRLRPTLRFTDIDALIVQMDSDVAQTREVLGL